MGQKSIVFFLVGPLMEFWVVHLKCDLTHIVFAYWWTVEEQKEKGTWNKSVIFLSLELAGNVTRQHYRSVLILSGSGATQIGHPQTHIPKLIRNDKSWHCETNTATF